MVPVRIVGTHSVVKFKSESVLWRANDIHLLSDADPLCQSLEHTCWFETLGAAFLKTRCSPGWTAGMQHICMFPALSCEDFSLLLLG